MLSVLKKSLTGARANLSGTGLIRAAWNLGIGQPTVDPTVDPMAMLVMLLLVLRLQGCGEMAPMMNGQCSRKPSRRWIMEGHGGPHHPLGHLGPWRIPHQNSNSVVFQMSFQTNRLTNIYELDGLKKIQVEDHPNSQISVMESVSALDSMFHVSDVSGVLLQSGM